MLYPYQKKLKNDVLSAFKTSDTVVMAAAPSSGKTITAIEISKEFKKTLIIPSGYSLIREQWASYLPKSFCLRQREELRSLKRFDAVISLPQTLKQKWVDELPKIDLLIVDEAHLRTKAPQMQKIIAAVKPNKTLLLSGTPSSLVNYNHAVVGISPEELFELDVISDADIRVESGKFNVFNENIDRYGELKSKAKFDLENLCHSVLKSMPKSGKTMVVLPRQLEAVAVTKYLEKNNIKALISVSAIEGSENAFDEFKKDVDVLVVVNRGILGFDYPDLSNIIDCSFSFNPNRVFQLMARLMRKSPLKKKYIRLTSDALKENTLFLMHQIASICTKDLYFEYATFVKSNPVVHDHVMDKLALAMEHKDLSEFMSLRKLARLNIEFKTALKTIYSRRGNVKYTVDLAIELARKCDSRTGFKKEFKGAYNFLLATGNKHRLDEIFPTKEIRKWAAYQRSENIALLQRAADQCETRREFKAKYSGGWKYLQKNGLTKKIKLPKNKLRKPWDDIRARECAEKCSSVKELRETYGPGLEDYFRARNMPWPEHFKKVQKWTVETALEAAKPFKKRSQFRQKFAGADRFLQRKRVRPIFEGK